MRILAIDTALEACSVVLMDDENVIAREHQEMARGHAEALMPMIARLRETADLDFASLDRIAVTVGPGSFTGLRVGISAARGFALAADKPVVGITTLGAFAAPLITADASSAVVAVVDARHGHVYLQIFAGDGATLVKACIVPIKEAVRLAVPLTPRIVGNAASILAAAWPEDEAAPLSIIQQNAPAIEWVARLGAVADADAEPPKPLYLKAPDAQPSTAVPIARQ